MSVAPRLAALQDVVSVALPGEEEFLLPPLVVRENDTSASSIDEWTGVGWAQRGREERGAHAARGQRG
jgi:hypothetical protein